MSGHEGMLALEWLNSVLSGDSTLSGYAPGGVWRGMAPQETPTPFIILSLQSGSDVVTMNAVRLMDDLLVQVKAVGPAATQTAMIANAAARMDALIGNPPNAGTTQDGLGYVLASYRQSPLIVDELVAGDVWTNIGGLYRIEIEQIH